MLNLRTLPSLVRKQFQAAQESGDLTFYPTRVAILECEGVPVCQVHPTKSHAI